LDNIVLIHTIRMGTISAPRQSPLVAWSVFKSFLHLFTFQTPILNLLYKNYLKIII
jgi:hypothetical protein